MTREPLFAGAQVGEVGPGIGHFVQAEALARYADGYRVAAARLPAHRSEVLQTSRGQVLAYRFEPALDDERTPLLLLSGRNAGVPSWAPALPSLLDLGYPITALDSPGEAGGSVQTAPLDEPSDQAAWVAESVSALGLGRVHLIGHSLGGWVSAQVLRHRPDVLTSVTVLDPPSTFARLSVGFVVAGLAAAVVPLPDAYRLRLLRWMAGGSTGARPGPGVAELEELGLAGLKSFRVRQPPPSPPRPEDLLVGQVPSLVVLGRRSRVHDAGAAALVAESLGWRVETWSDAGHTLHVDFPQRLAALIAEHTTRADGRL